MTAAQARITHPGHDWFDAKVTIRRVADGLVRVVDDTAIRGGWRFQWGENNYSCDCNRALFFARAAGEPDPEIDCSEGLYVVERITDAETGEVLIEGEPRR